jgi:hypothetical protein
MMARFALSAACVLRRLGSVAFRPGSEHDYEHKEDKTYR